MTSKVCFENFIGKAFGTLICEIGKSTFLKNTIRNIVIIIIKTLKIPFLRTMLETM